MEGRRCRLTAGGGAFHVLSSGSQAQFLATMAFMFGASVVVIVVGGMAIDHLLSIGWWETNSCAR